MQRCFLALLIVSLMANYAAARAGVTDLKCEHLVDPLGVDVTEPRLSWILTSARRAEKQTAYRLLVASSRENLGKDIGDLWDSGQVKSNRSIYVAYAGKRLESRIRCHWKVRVWDKDGKASNWSKTMPTSMTITMAMAM